MKTKTSVDPEELVKFRKLSSEWWNKKGALKTLHDINPARVKFIQSHVDFQNKRFLDLGCGGGILAEALAALGAKVTGIDAEFSAIEAAKAHLQLSSLSVNYEVSAIEDFQSEGFDIISCMELLEHVENPYFLLEKAEKLLKPGGYLFLSTINRSWQAYFAVILGAEYLLSLLPKQTHDYKKFIKPAELAAILRELDLEVVACKGLSYQPLTGKAKIIDSVKVNYMIACRKG